MGAGRQLAGRGQGPPVGYAQRQRQGPPLGFTGAAAGELLAMPGSKVSNLQAVKNNEPNGGWQVRVTPGAAAPPTLALVKFVATGRGDCIQRAEPVCAEDASQP